MLPSVPPQARLELASDHPLGFRAGVKVFALDEDAVRALEGWLPDGDTGLLPLPHTEAAERQVTLQEVRQIGLL